MPEDGSAPDYEHLAGAELEAASRAASAEGRAYHLDQAAIFAHLSEKQNVIVTDKTEVDSAIATLEAVLNTLDVLGLSVAAIHINAAITALGGEGVPPPSDPKSTDEAM